MAGAPEPSGRHGALGHAGRHQPLRGGCNAASTPAAGRTASAASRPRTGAQWIRKIDLKEVKTGRALSLPMMCQHCANPPCVDVCPTGASLKRADGIVLVNRHTCIGCRYCMMACPYKARSFVHEPHTDQNPEVPRGQGCVEGCTLCVHRVDRGRQAGLRRGLRRRRATGPAVRRPERPESAISKRIREVKTTQVRADLKLDLGVRYEGL